MSVTNAAEMFSQLSQVRTSMVAKYTELEQSLLEASTEIESAVSEKFALKQAVSEESNELERLVEGAGAGKLPNMSVSNWQHAARAVIGSKLQGLVTRLERDVLAELRQIGADAGARRGHTAILHWHFLFSVSSDSQRGNS